MVLGHLPMLLRIRVAQAQIRAVRVLVTMTPAKMARVRTIRVPIIRAETLALPRA